MGAGRLGTSLGLRQGPIGKAGRKVGTARAQQGRAQPSRRRRLAVLRAVETSRIMACFLALRGCARKSLAPGRMVPVTPIGKAIGGLSAVVGLGMVALPAGLLASGFSEQLHERRREFESEVDRIPRSGVISAEEATLRRSATGSG